MIAADHAEAVCTATAAIRRRVAFTTMDGRVEPVVQINQPLAGRYPRNMTDSWCFGLRL